MKKLKIIVSVLIGSLALTSCNDYLDVNESPNAVAGENLVPSVVFPGAVAQVYRTQGNTMMQFGNLMMNSWAGNSYSFGGPFSREYTLSSVDNSFYNPIWNNLYLYMANFDYVENYEPGNAQFDYYRAMSKVMKSYYMQTIVDLYGDAPYSQAFKGQQNLTPAYDNDENIYRAIYEQLEVADGIFKSTAAPASVASADIIFKGNTTRWMEFSNSLKLRILLRMHKVTGAMATFRDQKLTALSTATGSGASGFLSADATENPGYSGANDDQMNPFLLTWRVNSAGSAPQNYNLITASENIAIALNGNNFGNTGTQYQKFNGLPDPRRSRLFTLVPYQSASVVKGVRQGATPGQPGAPTDNITTSRLATGNFVGGASVSTIADLIAAGNARGGVLMSLAESKLLLAEASVRYPSRFTVGQSSFNDAITSHFSYVGVPLVGGVSQAIGYIASINTRPGLGWVGTDTQKIEAIMTQKWLALTNVNPTEMFIEYNRTGFPITPLATTAAVPNKPYRLVYPVSEYVANSANVPNVTQADVFVKNQYTPFWNQN